MPPPNESQPLALAGSGDGTAEIVSTSFTQGARFGELLTRVSALEQDYSKLSRKIEGMDSSLGALAKGQETLNTLLATDMAERKPLNARIIAHIDRQDAGDAKRAKELKRLTARNKQQYASQKQRDNTIIGALVALFLTLVGYLLSQVVKDMQPSQVYLVIGGVIVLVFIALVFFFRRNQAVPPMADEDGDGEED